MGSFSGAIQRPLMAACAVAAASVSAEFSDRFPSLSHKIKSFSRNPESTNPSLVCDPLLDLESSWVESISASKLSVASFLPRTRVPVPRVGFPIPNLGRDFAPNKVNSAIVSSQLLGELYQPARSVKAPNSLPNRGNVASSSSPDVVYRWHLPERDSVGAAGSSSCSSEKSRTVVVLLGWLGAKQKHLKRYAEWYNSNGFHAITFTFPMSEILSYQVGGKTEEHINLLVEHLADWLEDEDGKNLVFHTFSNTGWLTYGAILEGFQKQDSCLKRRIKGCIVDSAPVAAPDPQVFASGFSTALLKKRSVGTKGVVISSNLGTRELDRSGEARAPKPAVAETALLLVLERFFALVLNIPKVNRRLSDVLGVLSVQQPSCPQLYIYSSADRVIPSDSVESFIEKQKKAGHEVRACNFVSTPHVDHFRNDPKLYTSQLTLFLEDCVLTSCKDSSSPKLTHK